MKNFWLLVMNLTGLFFLTRLDKEYVSQYFTLCFPLLIVCVLGAMFNFVILLDKTIKKIDSFLEHENQEKEKTREEKFAQYLQQIDAEFDNKFNEPWRRH